MFLDHVAIDILDIRSFRLISLHDMPLSIFLFVQKTYKNTNKKRKESNRMSLRTHTLLWLMRRIESGKQRGWKYQVM